MEAQATRQIRAALRATGISNFELIKRDQDRAPSGLCVQFSFVDGHVYPDDARRLLTSLVQCTLPDLQVYDSRTWSHEGKRIVCICTCPRSDSDAMILLEELNPVHATVRQVLYEAGILSSPNVLSREWPDYRRDRYGRYGFMIWVDVVRPTNLYPFPRDVILTVTCEPQGTREDQDRRVAPLLASIREALVSTGSFRYVLSAGDALARRGDRQELRQHRSQLGFNVTDFEVLREQQHWESS